MRLVFRTKILVVVLALSAFVAMPATSYATAIGYEHWGGRNVTIKGVSVHIPAGQLTHQINGSGYHINWDAANYGSVGNICDPSMRFTYGYGSYQLNGGIHKSCSHVGQWKYNLNWNAPRGDACAELWAKMWRVLVARQCHYVHG